jgi:hypothetical protein
MMFGMQFQHLLKGQESTYYVLAWLDTVDAQDQPPLTDDILDFGPLPGHLRRRSESPESLYVNRDGEITHVCGVNSQVRRKFCPSSRV